MAEFIMENTEGRPDPARVEIVTECNSCDYYRRGECGLSGLITTPDDYCSMAIPAEA